MKSLERDLIAALASSSLKDLQDRFPQQWTIVGEALVTAAQTRRAEALAAFMRRFQQQARPWQARVQGRRAGAAALKAALPHLAAAHMARLAAEEMLRATAAQIATGHQTTSLRFGRWSGWLVQSLFFARGLERKPVSMTAFRWLWPLITQRRILMPLVSPRGIFCFYSRELILALADRIGDRSCIEVAAGDGTLARFLNAAGTPVQASDDRSWSHVVAYPDDVAAMDAAAALGHLHPSVVLCSFPPPNNPFERLVFQSASVDTYIVITTRHRFAAGDWDVYERQDAFTLHDDRKLAAWVLPPQIDPAVLIFTRK